TMVKKMEIAITKMSSKGQIVIPANMRESIAEGDELIIIKSDKQFILKKANELDKNFKDDLIFAKRTNEALKRYEQGKFKSMKAEDFLKELKKW
ncbi:MAG: AbrB/MazE/SpoVT family DNA-binding domain-containing protein, partial [Nanoarchaeota archaeon]